MIPSKEADRDRKPEIVRAISLKARPGGNWALHRRLLCVAVYKRILFPFTCDRRVEKLS